MLRDNLRAAGLYQPSDLKTLPGGIIVTGGGARLQGVLETIEETLRRPTRMGMPLGMAKLPTFLAEPEFSVALGLVFYAHRSRVIRGKDEGSITQRLRAMFAKSTLGL
jgi:cell division protein FtsA